MNCSNVSLNVAPFDTGVAKNVRHNSRKCRLAYSRDSLYRSCEGKVIYFGGHNERGVGRECREICAARAVIL